MAQQYHVEHLLQPMIDFVPTAESPPLAPKHITAASGKPRKPKIADKGRFTDKPTSILMQRVVNGLSDSADSDSDTESSSGSGTTTGSDSDGSSSVSDGLGGSRKRRKVRHPEVKTSPYAEMLIDHFVGSEAAPIPAFLINPPPDFDVNGTIDEEGHTGLHWACAMGKMKVVKLLLAAGADIYRVNHQGQTPLMRSVMFTNNYDLKTFPELFDLLQKTIFNIDKFDQTVFHHVASLGTSKQKQAAVKHYMEVLLSRLADSPEELASMINVQDVEGDTALNIAARLGQKRLLKLLVDHGADPKIRNKHDLTAEDHLFGGAAATRDTSAPFAQIFRPHLSETGITTTTKILPAVNEMMESLATSYDKEMQEKDTDLTQSRVIYAKIQDEIAESKMAITTLTTRASTLPELTAQVKVSEANLRKRVDATMHHHMEEALRSNSDIKMEDGVDHPTRPLSELQQQCKALAEEIVQFHIRGGTSQRSQEYRKLIALCCNIPIESVDDMLGALIAALESEDNAFLTM